MSGADCGQCVGNGVIDRLPRDTVSLRDTYASLCVAVGVEPAELSGRMRHAYARTMLDVYVHLFAHDDASEDMAALGR
jgi:integrase